MIGWKRPPNVYALGDKGGGPAFTIFPMMISDIR
jgi:hypothetical protein